MEEIKLMKGNEAIAVAAVRSGCDAYFGYPITPQSEVLETLMELRPWEDSGMVVLQAESEIASINMVYGAASCGKRVMTSSSSPGISLMSEGLSYMGGASLPCVVVNVQRGGPGLGTIQPSQSDYFQAVKAAGHGDFNLIVLAPNSVQEMYDFVYDGFDLAFKYRNPVMILSDGAIGQMMEKVVIRPQTVRKSNEAIDKDCNEWALTGKRDRKQNIITSLELDPYRQEVVNEKLQAKYQQVRENEVRYEEIMCDDAEYVMVAYGLCARICSMVVELARAEGIKVGVFRPITLFPYPSERLAKLSEQTKGLLVVEMNAGQMIQDVKLSVCCSVPCEHYGRMGGVIPSPGEVFVALKEFINKNQK